MGTSGYIRALREEVGHRLLLLPGVAAIVRDGEGRILMQRRADDGEWSLPAGGIDPGERPAEAIVREVEEETGLRVRPRRVAGVFGGRDFRRTYPNGDEVEALTVVFECTVEGGSLGESSEETAALRFIEAEFVSSLIPAYPRELFMGRDGAPALFEPPGG